MPYTSLRQVSLSLRYIFRYVTVITLCEFVFTLCEFIITLCEYDINSCEFVICSVTVISLCHKLLVLHLQK